MNQAATIAPDNSRKMLIAMTGIGLLCALLIVMTFEGTKDRVARLKAEALEQAVFKVIPGATQSQAYYLGEDGKYSTAEGKVAPIYAGYDDSGKLVGFALQAEGKGYADIIRMLYGYNPDDQTVVGFVVLESKETPGLGDKIEKDASFLQNFVALTASLNSDRSGLEQEIIPVKNGEKENPWEVDGITGATISSRAVASGINASCQEQLGRIQEQIEVFRNGS